LDKWTPITTIGAPISRENHTAIWTGSKMIIWGGYGWGTSDWIGLNTGGIYDPQTDTWFDISITNAPSGRILHTTVWTGSEMIIWGGDETISFAYGTSTGGRYKP
jgi:N-acetylneuraminic acid mutarotase